MLEWEGDQLVGGCFQPIGFACQSNCDTPSLASGPDGAAPHPRDFGSGAAFLFWWFVTGEEGTVSDLT